MYNSDVLIIGSGVAALQLAKNLSCDKHVIILTKSIVKKGNSSLAQGGIAAALAMGDDPAKHFNDTLEAGRFINDKELVKEMTQAAPGLIQEIASEGCKFDRAENGSFQLGLEGAHSHHRIVHSGGDATGKNLMNYLVAETRHIKVIEEMVVFDLLKHKGKCVGAKAKDKLGHTQVFQAKHIVLATGGLGQLYSYTSNEETVTGDGIALAYRAGAEVEDLEFIQFHPTLLYVEGTCRGLVSEAVRGEGAKLVLKDGTRIMKHVHPLGDLAPRHIVSQTIFNHWQSGHQVFLDIRRIPKFKEKFPTISKMCETNGIDLTEGFIPVVPGCHFLMGGVKTDQFGRTSIPNLYAIGEVACTGVHGANRLASNSLLEGLFFGKKLAHYINSNMPSDYSTNLVNILKTNRSEPKVLPTKSSIQSMMMKYVGIVRNRKELKGYVAWLESFDVNNLTKRSLEDFSLEDIQATFMLITSWLVATSALLREESRGGHYREDFPFEVDSWLDRKIIIKQTQEERETDEHTKAAFAT